jgi:hypothetical protein
LAGGADDECLFVFASRWTDGDARRRCRVNDGYEALFAAILITFISTLAFD